MYLSLLLSFALLFCNYLPVFVIDVVASAVLFIAADIIFVAAPVVNLVHMIVVAAFTSRDSEAGIVFNL